MITAIIPSYRNPDYLDLCLKSATENMVAPVNGATEIMVILDGFVDESQEIVEKYDGIRVLALPENKGMQYAINVGVMQANNPYVFVLNDDNVFGTEWDDRLRDEIIEFDYSGSSWDQKFVMTVNQVEPIGPGMFHHHIKDIGQDVGTFRYDDWMEYEKEIAADGKAEFTGGGIFPFIVKKKHFMAIGGMDTFYNSPNICDWDMFLKFELLDFWFPRTYGVHLYHFGSVVTKKNSESAEFAQRQSNAMAEYAWKWGANPYNEPKTNSKVPPNFHFRGFQGYPSTSYFPKHRQTRREE